MVVALSSPSSVVLSRPERQWRAALTLGWPLALGAAPLLLSLGDVPLCAFRQLTGRPCPLCGGTRACAALAEGNLMAAWQANPGLMPLFALAAVHVSQLAYEAWSGRKVTRWQIGPGLWGAGTTFLLCDWVLRLAT
jgi:hypothetical protein